MANRFPASPRPSAFRRRHFPDVPVHEWNDWRWQLRNSFTDLAQLEHVLQLSPRERSALEAGRQLPTQVTPYYASLLNERSADDPLRRTVVMTPEELQRADGEAELVACPRQMCSGFRSAAPGWQGATTENTGSI